LTPIGARSQEIEAQLTGAKFAMDTRSAPQVLITMAARFGRVSWKYSSLAYALILKDVGVLTQTLYLMATDMGLGGCAIGNTNIDLFAKMTGIDFHVEGRRSICAWSRFRIGDFGLTVFPGSARLHQDHRRPRVSEGPRAATRSKYPIGL
jgi:nitroreductase